MSKHQQFQLITLNEFAFGSVIGAIANNYSIIGIYITVVLAVGRFLRGYFDRTSQRVIYEEIPNTKDLKDLCESKINFLICRHLYIQNGIITQIRRKIL